VLRFPPPLSKGKVLIGTEGKDMGVEPEEDPFVRPGLGTKAEGGRTFPRHTHTQVDVDVDVDQEEKDPTWMGHGDTSEPWKLAPKDGWTRKADGRRPSMAGRGGALPSANAAVVDRARDERRSVRGSQVRPADEQVGSEEHVLDCRSTLGHTSKEGSIRLRMGTARVLRLLRPTLPCMSFE